jgi:hypothetical protein
LVEQRFVAQNHGRERQRRVMQLLQVLDICPSGDPPPDLVATTLSRVDMARAAQRSALGVGALRMPAIPLSWSEVGAIAAMLLIGISLALPVLGRQRQDARMTACASNLAVTSMALHQYAADFEGVLPRGQAQPGARWFNVGGEFAEGQPVESNSAHLFLLARAGYISPDAMVCPENRAAPTRLPADRHDWPTSESVSFSYQNQYAAAPTRPQRTPKLAILADKNPLFAVSSAGFRQRDLSSTTRSAAHAGRGQNVLIADGHVKWMTDPVLANGDNIWMAAGVNRYTGRETPSAFDDAFLVP